ncbi:MAG TPA: glycosyltransferase family 9 protein [Thermomicrobiales bacterium]|nr:glycosyltransferase family 9 protein [Thermomicrobiales bacterium]
MRADSPPGDPFAPGLLARLPAPPRKVAVLRASRIGDFICATPAFRALRAALPDAELTIITLPLLRDLATRLPCFDQYAAFPGFPGLAEQFFDARRVVAFFRAMQAERFDLAVQLQGSGVNSNPFTLLLGARSTAGYVRAGDGPGRLAAALPYPGQGHEIARALALTTFLGAPPRGARTIYPLRPEDHAAAAALLAGAPEPLIGLHPDAREATRRWPPARFAAAGAALLRERGGTAVLIGDEGARPAAADVARRLGRPCLDLTGRTSLPVLGAVVARLALLVTNDTGPAHIAYALGTPTVTLFGSADPARYGPPRTGPFRLIVPPCACRSQDRPACADGASCLAALGVDDVVGAGRELLGSGFALTPRPPLPMLGEGESATRTFPPTP